MTAPAPSPSPASATTAATTDLDLGGMTCAACARHVDRALRTVDGVQSADVSFARRRARVQHDPVRARPADLVAAVEGAGYEVVQATEHGSGASPDAGGDGRESDGAARLAALAAADAAEQRSLVRDAAVAALATVPLLVLAMSHGAIPGADGTAGRAVQVALATLVLFGPGRRFLHRAWLGLRKRTADMNTLVALGSLAAWGWSTVALLAPGALLHGAHGEWPHVYFEAAATIVTFVLFGRLLEARARRRLGEAVRRPHALTPALAHRRTPDGGTADVPVAGLRPGDEVFVRPRERVPSDGEVLGGASAVDESMLTGESLPVDKAPSALVFGGTQNTDGLLHVRITRTGRATALARIAAAVEAAQGSRAPIAQLADRTSAVFVPVVLGIALLAFAGWIVLDPSPAGVAVAIERMVAVFVIACPCALGLATPAAVAVGTGRCARSARPRPSLTASTSDLPSCTVYVGLDICVLARSSWIATTSPSPSTNWICAADDAASARWTRTWQRRSNTTRSSAVGCRGSGGTWSVTQSRPPNERNTPWRGMRSTRKRPSAPVRSRTGSPADATPLSRACTST